MTAPLTPRFDGQLVVVTGVGRAGQVGEAVARRFAQLGARVAILARTAADATARADALCAEGYDVRPYHCDLNDAGATAAVAASVAGESGGRIHALANIAGGFAASGPVADSDPTVLQRQLDINLGSAYGATRACLPYLRAARGAALFVASAAVLPGGKVGGNFAYTAAKSAVLALMRAVAQEERPLGVRANAVAPTAIRTGSNLESMGSAFPYVEREAFADVVAFLCSSAAANVSGQVIELA